MSDMNLISSLLLIAEEQLKAKDDERHGNQINIWLDGTGVSDSALELKEAALHTGIGGQSEPLLFQLITRVEIILVQEGILKARLALALVATFDKAFARRWHTQSTVVVASIRVLERVGFEVRLVALVDVELVQSHVDSDNTSKFEASAELVFAKEGN